MKVIQTFKTKKGRVVEIIQPTMDLLDAILEFVHHLAKEDTFLSFDPGKEITREDEKKWLENNLKNIKNGKTFLAWAIFDYKIIGSVDINRGHSVRDWHIGSVGLMVDQDFRGEGLGKFLLQFILEKGKEMGIKTASVDVFSDNKIALSLYQKAGFKEWGRLPDGLYRQNKFSDKIEMYKNLEAK